jgi:hypothetical protein
VYRYWKLYHYQLFHKVRERGGVLESTTKIDKDVNKSVYKLVWIRSDSADPPYLLINMEISPVFGKFGCRRVIL